ncbi:GNAT family N-acetyltransferase [Gemmatimonas sp.]|jgi:GNAT superfamily N-acetyltransferase|uniref:GNAT family N-acetyltransferase n=1 Tax=Gemmatimonas sp. TaxID=1962908 RepID=UPI0037BFD7D5
MSSLPSLPPGYSPVPQGHVASVVTYLEMTAPPAPNGQRDHPARHTLERLGAADYTRYQAVYRAVGSEWLWFSRLRMDDSALRAIIGDPQVEAYVVCLDGRDIGLLELDFREGEGCELAFLGLVKEQVGQGVGRWLMDQAIVRAWSRPIQRFHVHTCTLDHPNAVAFYVRSGFTPIRRAVEVALDPRLVGELPRDVAAHAPLIGG